MWLFEIYKANSNTLRDLQLVMFAGMVMLGAAWTLKVNEHVRVDLAIPLSVTAPACGSTSRARFCS